MMKVFLLFSIVKKDRSYWPLNIISGLNNVFVAHFSLGKSDPQEICLTVICIPDF